MAEHKTLPEALAAFQAEVPKMTKDETAKVTGKSRDGSPVNYKYSYAGLDQFVEIVEPVLGKHGLAVTGHTAFIGDRFTAVVSLLHESGEERTSYWPLPDPTRVGPQDIGSALTYIRRYLGWMMTGTFPGGMDDDGAQAQQSPRDSWENAQPVRQVSAPPAPEKPKKTSWTDDEVRGYLEKMATADVQPAVMAYDWMAERDLHKREVSITTDDGPYRLDATGALAGRIADEAMKPDMGIGAIKMLQTMATDRGLMKVRVSATETLAEALFGAQELAAHAAVEQAKADTPDPADLK